MAKEAQINLSFQGAGRFLSPGVKVLMWDNVRGDNAWVSIYPDPTNPERYFNIYPSPKLYIHDHKGSRKVADWNWLEYLGNDWMWTSLPHEKTFGLWNKGFSSDAFSVSYAHWNYREDAYDEYGSTKSTLIYFRIEGGVEGFQDEVLYKEPPWLPQGAYDPVNNGWYRPRFFLHFNYCGKNLHWTNNLSWPSTRQDEWDQIYRSVEMYVDESGVTEYNWWESLIPSPIGDLSNSSGDNLDFAEDYTVLMKGVICLNVSEVNPKHLYYEDDCIFFGGEKMFDVTDFLGFDYSSLEERGIREMTRFGHPGRSSGCTPPWTCGIFGTRLGEYEAGQFIGYSDIPDYNIWNWTTLHGDYLYVIMYPDIQIFYRIWPEEKPTWLSYDPARPSDAKKNEKIWVYRYPVTKENLTKFGLMSYIGNRRSDITPEITAIAEEMKTFRWREFDVFAPGGAGIGLPCAAGLYLPG